MRTQARAVAAWSACAVLVLALETHHDAALTQELATFVKLPGLGGPTEAIAVDPSGTFISGYSWDRKDILHAVKWTFANGTWSLAALPMPPGAVCSLARAVNMAGEVGGYTTPASTARPVLWTASGVPMVLGCAETGSATVYGMSAGAQVLAGVFRQGTSRASVWRPGTCREILPVLLQGPSAIASAINDDGTIVVGSASPAAGASAVPVRWTQNTGEWQIEALDIRAGSASAIAASADVAGHVRVPCVAPEGCLRATIWNADGTSQTLGTLGGADSWARGINSNREVVGASTAGNGINTGFFWSPSVGMVELPAKARWAAANAVSEVRLDGSRVLVGMDATGAAIAWTVRIP